MATTDTTTVEDRLLAAFTELGVESDEITPDTQLRDELDIDSAELVEIAASVAGEAPEGKALKQLHTVGELADLLRAGP
jgi:acyl carrier protein